VNIRFRKPENQPEFAELFFDTEEFQVIGVDGGKLFRGMLQSEGKDVDFGAFDILGKIGIRAFDLHTRLLPGNDSGGVFNPVKNTVMDLLYDVIDGNASAGILKMAAAMIPRRGGEQGAVGGEDVEAEQSQFFDQRNQRMKDLLIKSFSNTNAKVGEGRLTGDAIVGNAGEAAVILPALGIVQDEAEVLDRSDSVEIAEKIQQEKRNGIIAGTAEDGIGTGCNGTDKGEIDDGSDQLRDAAANGTVVIDMNVFLAELVMGEPSSLFLGKGFGVSAVNERIDFPELSDNITDSEANVFAHVKISGVSREKVLPSKLLPGNPFLLVNSYHPPSQSPLQTKASDSSLSTKAGGTALRSFSWA
jgi:hypothetical protein